MQCVLSAKRTLPLTFFVQNRPMTRSLMTINIEYCGEAEDDTENSKYLTNHMVAGGCALCSRQVLVNVNTG